MQIEMEDSGENGVRYGRHNLLKKGFLTIYRAFQIMFIVFLQHWNLCAKNASNFILARVVIKTQPLRISVNMLHQDIEKISFFF